MPTSSSPARQRSRRLAVAAALVLGLTAAAFASPASAEPTTTSSWASIPLVITPVPIFGRLTVVDGQAANAGKSVFIRWRCGTQVVQEATITLVAVGSTAQGAVNLPSNFNSGIVPGGCTLSEQWPNSLGAPISVVNRLAFPGGDVVVTHP